MKKMKRKKGFTLIELLVVIAIIALLMSIVMPLLHKAKEKARQIVCLGNQRSVILGALAYTVDNDGFYPPSLYLAANGGFDWTSPKPYGYSFDLRSFQMYPSSSAGHKRKPIGVGLLLEGGFGGVQGKFFHCPSLDTRNAVDPYTGLPLDGHGMDISKKDAANTWWNGIGASYWNDPDADSYRIVTSYAYRSPSWSQVNRKMLKSSNARSSLVLYMDVIDPRFGIYYCHKGGFNATRVDCSGRFLKVDFEDVIDWVRPAGVMDGLASARNDELVYRKIERLK